MARENAVPAMSVPTGEGLRLSLWERISLESARFFLYALARILSLGGLYHLGRMFATLEWLIDFKRRRRVNLQMERVLGKDSPKRRRRHATWQHFVRVRNDKMIYLILDLLPRRKVAERFTIINKHLLDESLARGNGMYMAMSHLGSHHLVITFLADQGYKVAGVRDPKSGAVHRFIQGKYERSKRHRVEYFYTDSFPRNIYRRFRDNFVVGSALDVNRMRRSYLKTVEVEVFGEKRAFLTGPLQIALRCGAPVVQAFVISRKNFRYVLEFRGPLIDPAETQESPELLAKAAQTYATNIEQFARRHPCHISRF